MNKHTPGPWKFTEGEYFYVNARVDGRRVFILQRKKSVVSAASAYQEAEEDRIHADCQLISAAPDLLADLQEAAATLRRYEKSHRAKGTADSTVKAEVNASLAARFEATIAKATGATP